MKQKEMIPITEFLREKNNIRKRLILKSIKNWAKATHKVRFFYHIVLWSVNWIPFLEKHILHMIFKIYFSEFIH